MRRPKTIGHLDRIENGVLHGWVARRSLTGAYSQIGVCAKLKDEILASSAANIFRDDLKAAGIGDGCFAFSLSLPAGVLRGGPYDLSVESLPDGKLLEGGQIAILKGHQVPHGSAYSVEAESFDAVHRRLQYHHLQRTIDRAVEINVDIGAVPAISLLYALILGRMPEPEVIDEYASIDLLAVDIAERANKLFFSAEASGLGRG